jgi:D-serine deaminase-like pyridoxal phosphate-dependent protein
MKTCLTEVETPSLLVDLDAMQRNISKMADYFKDKETKLRPHTKTHKSPVIARKQIDAGAIGICCQKLSEAEVMASAGIKNILITNEIVNPEKILRLINLSKYSPIIVALDNLDVARLMSKLALKAETSQDFVIEVNVGLNRCGVLPGKETLAFAKALLNLKGLRFRGLMGYEGPFFDLVDFQKRKAAATQRNKLLIETAGLLENAGLDVEIVSAGSTGTYNITGAYAGITEIEPGSYVFMDTQYMRLEKVGFESSLTLLTTVISRPTSERVVVDAGLKAITKEFGIPKVRNVAGAELVGLSEEHGIMKVQDTCKLRVGDKIQLIPSHCCTTCNLHDRYYGIRNERVETVWPISGRGMFF